MNYFKILNFMQKGNKSLFDVPVEQQQSFLNHLGKPKDDLDRSFKQYLCQNFFVPKWKILLLNFLFIPVPIFLIAYYFIKGLGLKKEKKVDAIASLATKLNIFDPNVLNEFNVDDKKWGKGQSLHLDDLGFCLRVLSKWGQSPYFVSKTIVRIAIYSDMIYKYSPKALLSHCEFSFTSSILTEYCKSKGVEHINTMHGEKLYYIRDAYFHFDRCYVWDKHYVDLFVSMNAEKSQFRIFIPESLKIQCSNFTNSYLYADYKYYLATFTQNELETIINSLLLKVPKGKSFKLRPHPRYSDMDLLKKHVSQENIEIPEDVTIQESISNCEYVIGSYTTVLNQAYFSGKKVVLDDITFRDQQEKLLKMHYFLNKKNVLRLTEINGSNH